MRAVKEGILELVLVLGVLALVDCVVAVVDILVEGDVLVQLLAGLC